MGTLVDIKQIKGLPEMLGTGLVRDYANVAGTAAVTTSPRWSALYDVTDPEVTEYTDGMKVAIVVPVAGDGSYGTALQINSLGYKPIVYAVSSTVSTRYPVGGIIIARYNAAQTAKIYLGSGHQNETVTGCWQVMDYDSDTTLIGRLRLERGSTPVVAATYREVLVCTNLDGEAVPLHSTPASASSQYSSTSTNKEMSRELFNPFGLIAHNATPGIIAAGGNIPYERLYHQTYFNPRYSLNCGDTLVAAPLYLVAEPAEDGQARLAGKRPCWSQELPTQYDGLIYILLGHHSGDTYSMLYPSHPVYWHNGDHVCVCSGDENQARDLAPVERGPVASQAYAEGDIMMTGSGLRRATEDIEEEDTISAKTERTTIADEIKRNSKNEVEVSETEPTDPNVEVWIDPQGEADRKSAKNNGIAVLKRINPAKTRYGQRYFFSTGKVTIFLDDDTLGSVTDAGMDIMLSQNFKLIDDSPNGKTYRARDYGNSRAVTVTIISDEDAADIGQTDDAAANMACWLILAQMYLRAGWAPKQIPGFADGSELSTNDLASPYFVIRKGKVVCTKEVVFENGMPAGKDLGRRAFGVKDPTAQAYSKNAEVYDITTKNRRAHYRRGNGYGVSNIVSQQQRDMDTCKKMSKPVFRNKRGDCNAVYGIARGKLSAGTTMMFSKNHGPVGYYHR